MTDEQMIQQLTDAHYPDPGQPDYTEYAEHRAKLQWAAAKRIEELRAIVERLPKTRDGKPIHPGMHLWDEDTADDFDREYPSETNMLVTTVTNYAACASQGEDTSEYEQSYRCGQDDCCQECDGSRGIGNVWSTRSAAERAKEADRE